MTKEELEKATGQELIEQRNYCGVDGYYGDYILDVNAEMFKRFNRLTELEKENAELKTVKIPQLERKIASIRGAHSVDCKKLNARTEQVERLKKENEELREKVKHRNCVDCSNHGSNIKLIKARELILKLYNAGRDVLMCRAEEKAYDNLSEAINDRSIEKFLSEVQ